MLLRVLAVAALSSTTALADTTCPSGITLSVGGLAGRATPSDKMLLCGSNCPVVTTNGVTFFAFSYRDNRMTTALVGYDVANGLTYFPLMFTDNRVSSSIIGYDGHDTQIVRVDRDGARYVDKVALDCVARTVRFSGQDAKTITVGWNGLVPPKPTISSIVHGGCTGGGLSLTACPLAGGGALTITGTGFDSTARLVGGLATAVTVVDTSHLTLALPAGSDSAVRTFSVAGIGGVSTQTASIKYAALPPSTPYDARALLKAKNCLACHSRNAKMVGPAFIDIAAKYRGQRDAEAKLVSKTIKGSSGVWGEVPMPANLQVDSAEAHLMVKWILQQ